MLEAGPGGSRLRPRRHLGFGTFPCARQFTGASFGSSTVVAGAKMGTGIGMYPWATWALQRLQTLGVAEVPSEQEY